MSSAFKTAVLVTVAAILCAATFIRVPHLRNVMAVSDGYESPDGDNGLDETEADLSSAAEFSNTGSSRAKQTARNRSSDSFGDREET